MERLLTMDKEHFISEMLAEARQAFGKVADAVNQAGDGRVISGSEMQVRDVMVELQRRAFEKAVQMRIDSTESSFSPSAGRGGQAQTEQGAIHPQPVERQRPHRDAAKRKRRDGVMKKRREKRARPGQRRRRLPAARKGSDQRWKQVYLTRFYDQENKHRLVSVTRGNHRALGKLLRREAARLRIRAADQRIGLVDGAVCLRRHLEGLPLSAVGLDFYHLGQHVNQGRRDTFGDNSTAGRQWADDALHTVRHERYEPFWQILADWRQPQRGNKRKAADELLHYVAQRREMMNYDEFERHNWHVGTGPIESMCKATTRRIKGSGMRWDIDNAEAMMALECLYQSEQWDRYWTKAVYARN